MSHRHSGEDKAARTAELIKSSSVSIEQAIRVASEGRAGIVIEAKLKRKLKGVAWKIRLLTEQGQVRIYVDGSSGAIIATKLDHHDSPPLPLIQPSLGTPV